MGMFLQIVGSVVLVVIILIVLGYLYIKRQMNKMVDANVEPPALLICLNEDFVADWLNEQQAKDWIDELVDCGFAKGKAYLVEPQQDCKLFSMVADDIVAVVYLHDQAGYWVDLVFTYQSGAEITVSNAPLGGELKSRSDSKKVYRPNGTPSELYALIKGESAGEEGVKVALEDFRQFFENCAKKDISWRNNNGGTSFEEFKAIAQNDDVTYSEEEIYEGYQLAKMSELEQWHEAGLEELFEVDSDCREKYQDCAEQLFIVPIKTDPMAYLYYLANWALIDESQIEQLPEQIKTNTDIPALFATINDAISEQLRAIPVATIDFPVKSAVFYKKLVF